MYTMAKEGTQKCRHTTQSNIHNSKQRYTKKHTMWNVLWYREPPASGSVVTIGAQQSHTYIFTKNKKKKLFTVSVQNDLPHSPDIKKPFSASLQILSDTTVLISLIASSIFFGLYNTSKSILVDNIFEITSQKKVQWQYANLLPKKFCQKGRLSFVTCNCITLILMQKCNKLLNNIAV